MTYLQAVPDLPAEDTDAPVKIETWGDLIWDFHGMVAEGHIGAALIRMADWAERCEDVPLPDPQR